MNCFNKLERINWLAPLVSRITLGVVFIQAGWGKLGNLDRVIEYFQSLGIPASHIQAPMVAGFELVCGALVLAGFATRIVAVPLMIIMAVAIRMVHWEGFLEFTDIFEVPDYLYMLLLFWLFVQGAGKASFDYLVRLRKSRA
ncbi:MAG: DoxX family protein [Deltaproteobacteria bacterium]|nr:DoxX family protein [Deltaproteobacteria bacterium]